jgi:lipopolysaccharide heptosyltransferase II
MTCIKFLKLLDKIIGKPILFLLPQVKKNTEISAEKIKRILLIRPGGIGDFVLLIPAIKALKKSFPVIEIDVLCEKRNADIAGLSENIANVYLYNKGFDLLKCLKNKYDIVIDTEQWHRLSAVAAYFAGAPVKIGFATNERKKLFTHEIPYSHDDYEVYSFFHLIRPLTSEEPKFNVDDPFIDIPKNIPSPLTPEQTEKNIAIFPGASVIERRWGVDKFAKVAEEFARRGYKIVIIGSKADKKDASKIEEVVPNCINLTGKTDLKETAVLVKSCKALLTADSGLMHLAYAVGTPTVSLFGAGIEKKWAPRGKNHVVINKHLECSPCTRFGYTPRCNMGVKCLDLIGAEEVIKALEAIIV